MRWLILILIACLIGCGQIPFLGDREAKEHMSHKIDEKRDQSFDGKLRTDYPAASTQNLNLSASGNSKIDLNLPAVSSGGRVIWETNQQNRMREEIHEDFVIDKWIKSVSPVGWALLCLCLSVLIFAVWWFIKTTSAGRAADAAVGASIDFARNTATSLNDKLKNMNPKSPEWSSINEMLNSTENQLKDLLDKQKPSRR